MPEDEKKSLVVAEDGDRGETLSEELGGFQALILFVLIGVVGLVVFAFPTPFNPAASEGPDDNLVETLGDLDADTVELATEPSATPTVAAILDNDEIEDTEGDSETFEAEDQLEGEPTATPTLEPTEAPTEVPTEMPSATPVPTDEPTEAPTDQPTEEADEADESDDADESEAADEGQTIASVIEAGDVDAGQAVFNAPYETSSGTWICTSCHSVDESQTRLVGPGLWGLYERADERAEAAGDADAVTYVYESIIAPAAYHVEAEPPYPENLMPQNYGEVLTEEELDDVIAYILTLGNPDA